MGYFMEKPISNEVGHAGIEKRMAAATVREQKLYLLLCPWMPLLFTMNPSVGGLQSDI